MEAQRLPAQRMFLISLAQCAGLILAAALGLGLFALLLLVMLTTQGIACAALLFVARSAIPQAVRGVRTGDRALVPPKTKDDLFWLTATASLQLGAVFMALLGVAT